MLVGEAGPKLKRMGPAQDDSQVERKLRAEQVERALQGVSDPQTLPESDFPLLLHCLLSKS